MRAFVLPLPRSIRQVASPQTKREEGVFVSHFTMKLSLRIDRPSGRRLSKWTAHPIFHENWRGGGSILRI